MSDRLLFLERYLMENTDEESTVSTKEILDAYQTHGLGGNRNIVPADIEKLREAGIEVSIRKEGKANCYHIAKRPFSTAELRTLIDAVSSSYFITKEKSDELIQKIAALAVKQKRDSMTAKTFTADRIKTDAPYIFSTIECIHNAIVHLAFDAIVTLLVAIRASELAHVGGNEAERQALRVRTFCIEKTTLAVELFFR